MVIAPRGHRPELVDQSRPAGAGSRDRNPGSLGHALERALAGHSRFAAASADTVAAVVEGAGQFAARWASLNRIGDVQGARLVDGAVQLPTGFREAYQDYVEAGWNAVACPMEFGGQALPLSLACSVIEALGSANMAFALLPTLTVGAIEAVVDH